MDFKSQIGTNINQSRKLLELGLKPGTADMYLEKVRHLNMENITFILYVKVLILNTGSLFA